MDKIDLSKYTEKYTVKFQIKRLIWSIINHTIFRVLRTNYCRKLRIFIINLFGAKMDYSSTIYSSVKIWAPWNLRIGMYSCIGPNVELYNKAMIEIEDNCVISQNSKLYTASHDISHKTMKLSVKPILIVNQSWIAADAFIGPGVTIGQGAVVGARAAVFKDVEAWTVVGGNPAKFIKKREITH